MTVRGPFVPERNVALFLDVDGTLLEIAATPHAVKVPAALRNTLQLAAAREDGALALISGRPVSELDRLFSPHRFAAAGLHGFERRTADGQMRRHAIDLKGLRGARDLLQSFAADHRGLLLEDKEVSLALHFRMVPRLEAVVADVMQQVAQPLQRDFMIRPGKFVVELAPRGCSKRTAIADFMKEQPFAGRSPVFVGDDLTDEDGFEVVNEMSGFSICVGRRDRTAARFRFGSVSAVVSWLRERNLNFHNQ
jgi:trehalose 6-phosphate phosphatase